MHFIGKGIFDISLIYLKCDFDTLTACKVHVISVLKIINL